MRKRIQHWCEQRLLRRHPIAETHWRRALQHCAPARRLDAIEQAALRVLATRFLRRKAIETVQGLELGQADRVLLAVHACVPILKLGLHWYRGFHSVIVYPGPFVPNREYTDHAGVVHASADALAGEAWPRGPVIVSWSDILESDAGPGHNVVIHEMAHKLDMLQGEPNGFPPLHKRMDARTWAHAFTTAWERLQTIQAAGETLPIDAYGLTNPAEFFAVLSEEYFERPAALQQNLPQVFQQLATFYRHH